MDALIYYGKTPVPWSVIWSEEEAAKPWELKPCQFASGMLAVCPPDKRGKGKPNFGATHPTRQRQAVKSGLCEICRTPLMAKTKVSLSEERLTQVDGVGLVPLVVEPLCCVKCAWLAVHHCPHLQKRAEQGELLIRQVFHFKEVAQLLHGEATEEFTGLYRPGAVGHMKMALQRFKLRDLAWLESSAA